MLVTGAKKELETTTEKERKGLRWAGTRKREIGMIVNRKPRLSF